MNSTQRALANEIYRAVEKLNAPDRLLVIIGSWGDGGLSEENALSALTEWNDTHGRAA